MIKLALNIFLLFTLSFQLIPVKELGKLLISNEAVEEVEVSNLSDSNSTIEENTKITTPFHCSKYHFCVELFSSEIPSTKNIFEFRYLPIRITHEVQTPPPNWF